MIEAGPVVQVFEGNGPDPNAPTDEEGRPHGTWKSWFLQKVQGARTASGWDNASMKVCGEVDYEHGVQVGKARMFKEGGVTFQHDYLINFDPLKPGEPFYPGHNV